jgi:hypothetical protein
LCPTWHYFFGKNWCLKGSCFKVTSVHYSCSVLAST